MLVNVRDPAAAKRRGSLFGKEENGSALKNADWLHVKN